MKAVSVLNYRFQVIDFGCSEGKLISQLKRVECIEELVGIDVDHDTLDYNKRRARPFAADYLDPRPRPLTVSLYQGTLCSRVCWKVTVVNQNIRGCIHYFSSSSQLKHSFHKLIHTITLYSHTEKYIT